MSWSEVTIRQRSARQLLAGVAALADVRGRAVVVASHLGWRLTRIDLTLDCANPQLLAAFWKTAVR
jgi:hypothetical protein